MVKFDDDEVKNDGVQECGHLFLQMKKDIEYIQ